MMQEQLSLFHIEEQEPKEPQLAEGDMVWMYERGWGLVKGVLRGEITGAISYYITFFVKSYLVTEAELGYS